MMLQILCYLVLLGTLACSDDSETVIRKKPKPPAQAVTWAEAEPLVEEHCGNCHGGGAQKAIDSQDRLQASKGRIADGSMPPGGGLPDDVKAKLLGAE